MFLFILLVVGVAMFLTAGAVVMDPESRSVPQCAGAIAGGLSGVIAGGDAISIVLVALLMAASFRGYAAFVEHYADGSEFGFFAATVVLAILPPLFLLALPRDWREARDRKVIGHRRAAEQLWREEFAASGATDPGSFVPTNPAAVMPASVRYQLTQDPSTEIPTVMDGARRAAAEARARSEARRAYLDKQRYRPKR